MYWEDEPWCHKLVFWRHSSWSPTHKPAWDVRRATMRNTIVSLFQFFVLERFQWSISTVEYWGSTLFENIPRRHEFHTSRNDVEVCGSAVRISSDQRDEYFYWEEKVWSSVSNAIERFYFFSSSSSVTSEMAPNCEAWSTGGRFERTSFWNSSVIAVTVGLTVSTLFDKLVWNNTRSVCWTNPSISSLPKGNVDSNEIRRGEFVRRCSLFWVMK